MPELPEVNTFQQYFDGTALAQQIVEVIVHDDKIIRNVSGDQFVEKLTGRTFTGSYRRGKYLFAMLDNGHHLLLHFGMTGDLKYYETIEEQPKHERFVCCFDNGSRLGFDCPRKFARILYIEDLAAYIASVRLGEDALVISEKAFLAQMNKKKGSIKGFLLDQHNLAGVGNLYADEICMQTRIHPASRVDHLSTKHRKAIFKAMQEILKAAIKRGPYYKEYPEDWFWEWRVEGQVGPKGKGVVASAKIAGRTTYFVQGWQKLYE